MSQTTAGNTALSKLISTIGELPASPAIVSKVMGLASDLDTEVVDLSQVLSTDQSLTAKVLKLSNSSFYGRPKEVKTLEEAIPVLGFFALRSMVVATSAHSMYLGNDSSGAGTRLWTHSLATAVSSRQIAKHVKYPTIEEAFIAGLLHDIGKLVLTQKLADKYAQVINEAETQGLSFSQVEIGYFGFTHCDVARILLEQWSFPTVLIDAVSYHHDPASFSNELGTNLAHMVCLGNMLSKRLGVGFSDKAPENIWECYSAMELQLCENELEEILAESREHYAVEAAILN